MRGDVIARGEVRSALMRTLNAIMQDIMYGNPMESKDERLRRYGEMISNAIEKIPSVEKENLPVIRCRDCGFYPRPELFDEAPTLPYDLDSVCLLHMSDGYYPGDGCTHGRPREEYDAWKRN